MAQLMELLSSALALDVIVAEAYALHTIITNVGVEPAEVTVAWAYAVNLDPPGHCAVLIVERGRLSFKVPVARLDRSDCQRFTDAWLAFGVAKKSLSKEALDRMLYDSAAWRVRALVLLAMARKGFRLSPGTH